MDWANERQNRKATLRGTFPSLEEVCWVGIAVIICSMN
jgi:hypothetical protein